VFFLPYATCHPAQGVGFALEVLVWTAGDNGSEIGYNR
jgi:hypothetical protein